MIKLGMIAGLIRYSVFDIGRLQTNKNDKEGASLATQFATSAMFEDEHEEIV